MNNIKHQNMTPAQAHFAGRLDDLLGYRCQTNVREYEFEISARSGEHLDLNVSQPAFQYAPLDQWLEGTIWTAVHIEGEEVWRVWPAQESIEQAGYDFHTGQVSNPGSEVPVGPVPVQVMEVPDGWTETALHVLMECSDLHPESTLTQTRIEQVLGALEVDHPDHERLALWLLDVEGETVTLRGLIENAEDWASTESRRHLDSWDSREAYGSDWFQNEFPRADYWLTDCVDMERVADAILSDYSYTEARDGELHVYDL